MEKKKRESNGLLHTVVISGLFVLLGLLQVFQQISSCVALEARYCELIDRAHIISDKQKQEISSYFERLEFYNLIFCTEKYSEAECSQERANELARDVYNAHFKSEFERALVVTITYDSTADNQIYYGIYGPNIMNEIDGEKLIIEVSEKYQRDTMGLNPAIYGAIHRCLYSLAEYDYVLGAQEDTIHMQYGIWYVSLKNAVIITIILTVLITIGEIYVIVYGHSRFKKQLKEKTNEIEKMTVALRILNEENQALYEWKQKMLTLAKNKSLAIAYDEKYKGVSDLDATEENLIIFQLAIDEYEAMPNDVKKFSETNIVEIKLKLRRLLE